MPNTLVHLGIQGVLGRVGMPAMSMRWVFLGCVIPDIPWIMRRALGVLRVEVDPYWLMSYTTVQASLLYCLLLAAAFALLSRRFWPVLAVLAANSVLHLLLDAVEIKLGNGVHFLAPLSWEHAHFDLLWPHSPLIAVATGAGLIFSIYVLFQYRRRPVSLVLPARAKGAAIAVLCATYLVSPLWLLQGPYESDNHFMKTLHEVDLREGRRIGIDRGAYRFEGSDAVVESFAGEELRLVGNTPGNASSVSLSGVFTDKNTIRVEEIEATSAGLRAFASTVGLLIVTGVWTIGSLTGNAGKPNRGI